MLRQSEQPGNLGRMIADRTQGTAAEPRRLRGANEPGHHQAGVHRGVEEAVEMVVGERGAPQLADAPKAAMIPAEHEQHGCVGDPRHRRNQRGDLLPDGTVFHVHDARLLEIGLRGGGERAREQGPEQRRRHRLAGERTVAAVRGEAGELRAVFQPPGHLDALTKSFPDEARQGFAHGLPSSSGMSSSTPDRSRQGSVSL